MNPFTNTSAANRPAVIAEAERRFAANPKIAAEFDATGSRPRREKIIACLDFIAATKAENAALKTAVAMKKRKLAALNAAKAPAVKLAPKAPVPAAKAPAPAKPAPAAKPSPKASTPPARRWMTPPKTTAAPRPTPNAFQKYASMKPGPERTKFLRENSVAVQAAVKSHF